jgi:hypothetical protein
MVRLTFFTGREADGEDECQIGVGDLCRGRWKRRGASEQGKRLGIERGGSGSLLNPAAHDVALPIDCERDTGDPVGSCIGSNVPTAPYATWRLPQERAPVCSSLSMGPPAHLALAFPPARPATALKALTAGPSPDRSSHRTQSRLKLAAPNFFDRLARYPARGPYVRKCTYDGYTVLVHCRGRRPRTFCKRGSLSPRRSGRPRWDKGKATRRSAFSCPSPD